MKLYMSARNNNLALDFNVKLENKKDYIKALQKSEMLFSAQTSDYGKQPPENKFLFIKDGSENKVSFAENVLQESSIRVTANAGMLDRNTVYHAFTNELQTRGRYNYNLTKNEVSFPLTRMSYYKPQSSPAR